MANVTPPDQALVSTSDPGARQNRTVVDLRSLGGSGLMAQGGYILDDILRELQGQRGVKAYKEMGSNDATCGAILYMINRLLRTVTWRVEEASSAPFDKKAAEFLETCMHDMDQSWADFTSEAFATEMQYGHSLHEIVHKRRAGDAPQAHLNSHYADGRIGGRGLMSRPPDSIQRWVFDDNGHLLGAEQCCPPNYRVTFLPIQKCLLFRTSSQKGNPEGVSIFRPAYRAWWLKRGIENIEGVGVERDTCGIPVMRIPRQLMEDAENGDPFARQSVAMHKKIVTNLRRDAQEGLLMPSDFDEKGNQLFEISLLQSGGSRQFNTSEIIQRYDRAILRACMADFMMLGDNSGSGSFAMHSDKTRLFLKSLNTYIDGFCEELNNKAVRKLMKLNGFRISDIPRIQAGSLDSVDVTQLADALGKLAQAGMPLFPDDNLENFLRESAGLPPASVGADETEVHPQDPDRIGHQRELIDPPTQMPPNVRDALAEMGHDMGKTQAPPT